MWSGPPYIAANHRRPIDAGDRQRNASQYASTINAQLATSDRLSRNDSRTLMIHLLHQPNVAARGDGHATQLRQKIAQENPDSTARMRDLTAVLIEHLVGGRGSSDAGDEERRLSGADVSAQGASAPGPPATRDVSAVRTPPRPPDAAPQTECCARTVRGRARRSHHR